MWKPQRWQLRRSRLSTGANCSWYRAFPQCRRADLKGTHAWHPSSTNSNIYSSSGQGKYPCFWLLAPSVGITTSTWTHSLLFCGTRCHCNRCNWRYLDDSLSSVLTSSTIWNSPAPKCQCLKSNRQMAWWIGKTHLFCHKIWWVTYCYSSSNLLGDMFIYTSSQFFQRKVMSLGLETLSKQREQFCTEGTQISLMGAF